MIENVTIVDKNGNGILAEGLMHIQVNNSSAAVPNSSAENKPNTKYVFYTLNEMVDADQTKIYIAETADQVGKAGPIEDEEWKYLKNTMISIAQNKDVPDIEYLKLTGTTFNISDPRKLAVKLNIKQALKNAQQAHNIAGIQDPVVGGTSAGTFFDQSVMAAPEPVEQTVAETQVNIFNNPPQPIITESVDNNPVVEEAPAGITTPEVVTAPVVEPVVQTQLIDTSAGEAPSIIETPTNPVQSELPEIRTEQEKFAEEPVIGNPVTVVDNNVLAEEPQLLPPSEVEEGKQAEPEVTSVSPVVKEEKKVTRDDAIAAMVTLIEFFDMSPNIAEQIKDGIVNNKVEKSDAAPEIDTVTTIEEEPKVETVPVSETTSSIVSTTEVEPNVVVNVVEQTPSEPVTENVITNPVVENTSLGSMATPLIEESPIMGIINSANSMATPLVDVPIAEVNKVETTQAVEVASTVAVMPEMVQPVAENIAAPENPMAVPTIETPEFQNPMSYEASKSETVNNSPIANIIDTSVQGIQAAAPVVPVEEQINPGLIPVQFETPSVVETPQNTGTIQPTTPPPTMDPNYIPDVTPVASEPAEYVHTAQNNNGKVPINAEQVSQIEGPDVVMPDNAKNVQMVTQGMQGQGTLGPSGLVADPRTLNLAA